MGGGKNPDSMPMSLARVDFLEWRKKRPYKPSSRAAYQPARDSRPVTRQALPVASYRRAASLLVGWDPTAMTSLDSFRCCKPLKVGSKTYAYYSLPTAEKNGLKSISRLPFSMKVLLENLLRNEDGRSITKEDIQAVAQWLKTKTSEREIAFRPARVLMQDFTGVPAVVDLAAMRDAMKMLGGDPQKINPLVTVDLVCDHSVSVTIFGTSNAVKKNVEEEYRQNRERYEFLKWSQKSFDNFRVVPPGTGICHQVNLEYLSQTVWSKKDKVKVDGKPVVMDVAYPDTLVGTDSHTTMVNGLAVLGWGVGGIEAEAAMLGQPYSMLLPEVIGVKLTGKLKEGVTATDLVLTVTQMLRKRGVVGKFVEFFGPGVGSLSLADRATIGNMAPEYGATCGIFPVDAETLRYLAFTGRPPELVELVEAYTREQGMFHDDSSEEATYSASLELDLSDVEPSIAGPKRPQDRVPVKDAEEAFLAALDEQGVDYTGRDQASAESFPASDPPTGMPNGSDAPHEFHGGTAVLEHDHEDALTHGSVVIAAITSCTNTSNPSVMIGAGLLAKKAVERGLATQRWVKTSLAPGSKVVTEYLNKAGLTRYLEERGFNLVGYGCTTCIGNSGPLPDEVAAEVESRDLVVASVLSGNRNFEGRIQQQVRANYLASPPLVVAYALAGRMTVDLTTEPLGVGRDGAPVYLRDLWPTEREIQATMLSAVNSEMFRQQYSDVFHGDERWRSLSVPGGDRFE